MITGGGRGAGAGRRQRLSEKVFKADVSSNRVGTVSSKARGSSVPRRYPRSPPAASCPQLDGAVYRPSQPSPEGGFPAKTRYGGEYIWLVCGSPVQTALPCADVTSESPA